MKISVIIPTLNEESCLAETLVSIRRQRPHEIFVVDGGSQDATRAIARASADALLEGVRGRAAQMNLGAAHATGDILLFLHGDCKLEESALAAIPHCLKQRRVVAGCFTMQVLARGLMYRCIDYFATVRVRMTGLVYGDQGLFVSRALFERLGGFPPLSLMEDVYFSRQLKAQGRVILIGPHIFVSPRRWQHQGILRQTVRNWTLLSLAASGVSPNWLGKFYPLVR
jgi:rSAM/selenodomain-associated transferase 2